MPPSDIERSLESTLTYVSKELDGIMYLKEKQKLHSLSPLLQMLFDHYRKC